MNTHPKARLRAFLMGAAMMALSPCLVACPSGVNQTTDPNEIKPFSAEGMTPAQVEETLRQTRIAIREGRVEEAIGVLDTLARHQPNNADIFHLRGIARMRLGQFKLAIPDFQTAAEIKPSADLYYNLGLVLHIYGFNQRAVTAFKTALELSSDKQDPEIINNLASAYIQLGQFSEAISLLEPVTRARPGDGEAFTNMGVAYFYLDDLASAERSLLSAISADAKHPEAHYNLGRVYEKQGRPDAAASSYRQYVTIRPDAPDRDQIERLINRLLNQPRG